MNGLNGLQLIQQKQLAAVGGGAAPAEPLTPLLYGIGENPIALSDTETTIKTIPVEANKTYVITFIGRGTGDATRLFGMNVTGPSGATGVHTSMAKAASTTTYAASAALGAMSAKVLTATTAATDYTYLRAVVVVGATAGNIVISGQMASAAQTVTFQTDTKILVRETTNVEVLDGAEQSSSGSVFTELFARSVPAGKKHLIEVDIPYTSASTSTGIVIKVGTAANDNFVATIINKDNVNGVSLVRYDGTEYVGGSTPTNGGLVRIRSLVDGGLSGDTFTVSFHSEVNASAVTVLDSAFAEQRDVTDEVQEKAEDQTVLSITPTTTFSHTIDASTAYWLTSGGGFTTGGETVGLLMDMNGIPANGSALLTMQFTDAASGARIYGEARNDGTAIVAAFQPGATECGWNVTGAVVAGDAATFEQRHAGETAAGATIKAKSFTVLELVELAA